MNLVHVAEPSRTPVVLFLNSLLPISSADTFSLEASQAVPAGVHVETERLSLDDSLHVVSNLVSPSTVVEEAPSMSISTVVNDPTRTSFNVPSSFSDITVFQLNIRGWRSHCNELEAYLDIPTPKPKVVAITETFLNRGCNAELFDYKLVGRRDRPSTRDSFID